MPHSRSCSTRSLPHPACNVSQRGRATITVVHGVPKRRDMDGRQGMSWEDRMSSAPYLSPSGTLAPWAEAVRTDMPLRVDDLAALPDDGWQYELVEGVLIRMPASGYEASNVAARLLARLGVFVEDHALDAVTGADGGYRLDPERPRDTELVPDVAFVRVDSYLATSLPRVRQGATAGTGPCGRGRIAIPNSGELGDQSARVSLLRHSTRVGGVADARTGGHLASRSSGTGHALRWPHPGW